MTKANIRSVIDTLMFREAENSQRTVLQSYRDKHKIDQEFLNRVTDINQRLSNTDDLDVIEKLHSAKHFFTTLATYIDSLWNHINWTSKTFTEIDETYWNGCIHYQKLADENRFLKESLALAMKREELLMSGWRSERRKWNHNRLMKAS